MHVAPDETDSQKKSGRESLLERIVSALARAVYLFTAAAQERDDVTS